MDDYKIISDTSDTNDIKRKSEEIELTTTEPTTHATNNSGEVYPIKEKDIPWQKYAAIGGLIVIVLGICTYFYTSF